MSFEGRTAIVTGAARGIGRAICLELGRRGCHIAFCYSKSRAQADLVTEELEASGAKALSVQADVADFGSVQTMVKEVAARFGSVDYLVNNAGIVRDKLLFRMSEADWDEVVDTNLKGAFNFAKAVTPIMAKARFGSILNITSVSGLIGNSGQSNYAASKAGMIGLTKSLAKEFASRNITVNALALGFVDTEMTRSLSEEQKAQATRAIPLGRFGTPEEVALVAAYFLSAEARYITGQVLQVDGGLAI